MQVIKMNTQRLTKTLKYSYSYVGMLGLEDAKKEAIKAYEGYNPEVIKAYRDPEDEKMFCFVIEFNSMD